VNILQDVFDGLRDSALRIPDHILAAIILLTCVVAVPALLCRLSITQGNPTKGMLVCWTVIGVFFALMIPSANMVPQDATMRLAVIIACALLLRSCPRILAIALAREQHKVQQLARNFYVALFILLILQVFSKTT
jgi:hypothetical protein